jgi:hypothetical protein
MNSKSFCLCCACNSICARDKGAGTAILSVRYNNTGRDRLTNELEQARAPQYLHLHDCKHHQVSGVQSEPRINLLILESKALHCSGLQSVVRATEA